MKLEKIDREIRTELNSLSKNLLDWYTVKIKNYCYKTILDISFS